MLKSVVYQQIPVSFSEKEFRTFVLPHLSRGTRGPARIAGNKGG